MLQQKKRLRGGTIYHVAGVQPGTARAWAANNGLRLGARARQQEHPRYDFIDAAKLTLMRIWTVDYSIDAELAAFAVNAIEEEMKAAAARFRASPTEWHNDLGRPIVLLTGLKQRLNPEITTPEEYRKWAPGRAFELVLDLVGLMALTQTSFKNALEIEGVREFLDFQDQMRRED